jgi:hypothetical protein
MISRQQAIDALAVIEECRSTIRAHRSHRGDLGPVLRVLTPVVVHATKDFLPDRRVRWPVIAGWYVAASGSVFLSVRTARLMPLPNGIESRGAANRLLIIGGLLTAGYLVLQRLIVVRLRATRLRRPNLVAGLVMGGITACQQLVLRRVRRAGKPPAGSPAEAVAHVYPALEAPTALRLCALLDAAGLELEYARSDLLAGVPDVDDQLERFTAEGLVFSPKRFGRPWAFLTPRGRDVFAQHVQALHRASVSTDDTPH